MAPNRLERNAMTTTNTNHADVPLPAGATKVDDCVTELEAVDEGTTAT